MYTVCCLEGVAQQLWLSRFKAPTSGRKWDLFLLSLMLFTRMLGCVIGTRKERFLIRAMLTIEVKLHVIYIYFSILVFRSIWRMSAHLPRCKMPIS